MTLLPAQLTASPSSLTLVVAKPYLLFLGEADDPGWAKTAYGLHDWLPQDCIGEFALPGCSISTGLPRMNPNEARAAGARSMVIGVAPIGGRIDDSWIPALLHALEAGLDIVSGMHTRLDEVRELKMASERTGGRLVDVRRPPPGIAIGTGQKRRGRRLLTVGTDCALGKKYTALAITQAFRRRGVHADFRATGQTGILIAGTGTPIDAVVADFICGAAEALSPEAQSSHWDVIEGQGSLFHPAYAGVSLGLLYGSQPDVFVVCHDPRRLTLLDHADYPVPTLPETIELTLQFARRVNAECRCAGVSLNTAGLSDGEAAVSLEAASTLCGVPAADPVRGGPAFDALISACLG